MILLILGILGSYDFFTKINKLKNNLIYRTRAHHKWVRDGNFLKFLLHHSLLSPTQ